MTEQQGRLRPDDWLAALPDLKKSGNEHHGPCPVCGGTDRFRVNDKGAFCRKGCAFEELRKAVFGAAAPNHGKALQALHVRSAGRQDRGPRAAGRPRQAQAGLVGGEAACVQDRELPVFPVKR